MENKNETTELDAIMAASEPAPVPTSEPAPAPAPKPSVGRIVHYREPRVDDTHAIRAAIVTAVWTDTCVNLTVFDKRGGTFAVTSASLGVDGGCWSWPERV